jgi:hypothetical protein
MTQFINTIVTFKSSTSTTLGVGLTKPPQKNLLL